MAVTALSIPRLGSEFMPRSESPEFSVGLKLPEGTSLERTNSTAVKAEGIIKDLLGEKVRLIYTQSGKDNTSSLSQISNVRGENTASLKVILKDEYASEAENAISFVESYLVTIPDLEVTFTREETALQTSLGTTESPFALEISGEDYKELERILKESKTILETESGLYNLTPQWTKATPEVEVTIDRFKTSYYTVAVESVINQVKKLPGRIVGRELRKRRGDERYHDKA